MHDWTLVDAGIFHAFHVAWIPELSRALNGGLLPRGYYALPEQHAGSAIADVLTLHASPANDVPSPLPVSPGGGTAVAEAPPQVSRRETIEPAALARRRTLAIRHVSGHRLVAILEVLSPANKDRVQHVNDFVAKVVSALDAGVHVLLMDLFPPGRHDPKGMHALIRRGLTGPDDSYEPPDTEALTLASYAAGPRVEIYLEHLKVGDSALPAMPLFFQSDRYVSVPLEETYQVAWAGMPEFWRDVLEGRTPSP